ncbi:MULTISPECIES: STM4504/CBY_0614 family protein [unclassified Francisella]|uniref:STM4504/CBY_0614 family protein n=1 Tax=unclassified Francisella TaxID=2610885 RepID=UPI002E2ECBC9|nr:MULTISPECIES: hypothetical protein [unclassified Francisella]MED7818958.1 hypothetical protein [Francisella sp. 19S2-4]MED7829795.1 hypothetical protein [Francisella sp. 19S2-10]
MKLFSQRYKEENNLYPEIYQYYDVPSEVRILVNNSIIYSLYYPFIRSYGPENKEVNDLLSYLIDIFLEENPIFLRKELRVQNIEFFERILRESELSYFFDAFELLIKGLHLLNSNGTYCRFKNKDQIDNKIIFLNKKFLEYGFGYEFNLDCDSVIRVDNKLTHQEIVKASLHLLTDKRFSSANDEYLKAHDAYKKGNSKEVFINCSSSLESVMKIIIKLNDWEMPRTSTSSLLIDTLIENKFLKPYYSNILNNLKEVVSITSRIRNKEGGHGAGTEELCNDMSLMTYVINITASTILFLMEHQKEFELSK